MHAPIHANKGSAAPYKKQGWSQSNIGNLFQDLQQQLKKKTRNDFDRQKIMKLFFALAVVISSLVLLVQGAPRIRSEELGETMEQLKELINRELMQAAEANTWQWPYAQQRPPARQWPHAQQWPQV